jgi:hypothetical protein
MTRAVIQLIAALLCCLQATAASGLRITYDSHNLKRVVFELDLVDDCNGKTECEVKVLPNAVVKIKSTTGGTVPFDKWRDYSASGIVSQHLDDARLPENPCLEVEAPFTITWLYAKPAFEFRDATPAGWQPERRVFGGVAKGGFSFLEVPGAPLQVCIQPKGHMREDKAPAFAVLSLRLEADLNKTGAAIEFARTMKFASQPLADRVEDALNNIEGLRDDPEHLDSRVLPKLRLLQSALAGLRIALNPAPSGEYPSSASDDLRRAVHVVLQAWAFVGPELKPVPEIPIRRHSPDIAFGPRAFNSLLEWLRIDMETLRAVYGEPANRNYGKSRLVVPLAELLLAQLDRLRAVTDNGFGSGKAGRQDVVDWMAEIQALIVEIRSAAYTTGDASKTLAAQLIPELAAVWNRDLSQQVLADLRSSRAKDDMRLFNAFLDTLRRMDEVRKVDFKGLEFAGGISDFGNGDAVRCSRDAEGDFCYIDLLKNCIGRSACSTKLPFMAHWVASATRTGTTRASAAHGGWVRGEEIPVVEIDAPLLANNEVCSDLDIVAVLYTPVYANDRWTTVSGGVIGGRTRHQPQRETVFPGIGPSLSSHCVRLEAPFQEGAYVIKSVRVKINLDGERTSALNTIMINASHRLKQDLQEAAQIARDHQSLLKSLEPSIREYLQAIGRLRGEIDKSLLHYVSVPITVPAVRRAAAQLYVQANLLVSLSAGHEVEAQGFMTSLKQVIGQLSYGFGFNFDLSTSAEVTLPEDAPVGPDPEEAVKRLKSIVVTTHRYQSALETPYQPAIQRWGADLGALIKAVEVAPRVPGGHNSRTYRVDRATNIAAAAAVGSLEDLLNLLRKYPRYERLVSEFQTEQNWIAKSFEGPGANPRPAAKDSGRRLAPLIELLHFSIGEAERQAALKWSDPRFKAADVIQSLLRDQVLPQARHAGGAHTVEPGLGQLGRLWSVPAFQLLLVDVGKSNGGSGRQIEQIVSQIEQIMQVSLENLGLILPARSETAGIQ